MGEISKDLTGTIEVLFKMVPRYRFEILRGLHGKFEGSEGNQSRDRKEDFNRRNCFYLILSFFIPNLPTRVDTNGLYPGGVQVGSKLLRKL
jgi:hypothetical protein